jgi:hypothetical protein
MSNTVTEDEVADADGPEVMRDAMRRLMGKGFSSPKEAERKQREKKAKSIVDGRTLKTKGRSEQLNVKVRADIKQALAARVEAEGLTIADWIERTLEAALGLREN